MYYLLYADNYELPSKVAYDPEQPSLGRIRADSVVPPHSPITIKQCISRVERTPAIALADLFADITSNTPLKEDHISFLRTESTDCPGLSPKNPMAIVQNPVAIVQNPVAIVQNPASIVQKPSIPDGRYAIKNRAADFFWNTYMKLSISSVYFGYAKWPQTKVTTHAQVNEHSPNIQVEVFRE